MAACAGAAPMTSPSPGPASWSLPLDPLDPWDVLPRPTAGYSPDLAGKRLVRTDGRLPPEAVAAKLSEAEARPEQQLHPGHAAAERSGSTDRTAHHGRRMERAGPQCDSRR